MLKRLIRSLLVAALAILPTLGIAAEKANAANPRVRLTTNLGAIELELDAARAPVTVKNFLHYVQAGFYNGTVFHRVIPGFMIQGGGFRPGLAEKPHDAPIPNEADNGLRNVTGTIAMARTPDPDSAAAQFFINTVDNPFLDFREKSIQGWGYAVFGKVTKGMDVVHKIEHVATHMVGPFQDVPVKDMVIIKAEVIK